MILYGIVGVSEPKVLSKEEIIKAQKKFEIPDSLSFILSENYLKDEKIDKVLKDKLRQPLQIRIFHKADSLIIHRVNCEIGGFPNLNWNKYGDFNDIPPVQARYARLDTVFTLRNDLKNLNRLDNNQISIKDFQDADYTMMVYWAVFMKRQSKRLIRQAREIAQKHPEKDIRIYFVNTDHLYAP
jgi:hypothetical protein